MRSKKRSGYLWLIPLTLGIILLWAAWQLRGTPEGGSVRQIIDLLGLVTPGAEAYLRARDNAGLFKSLHPEYDIRNRNFDAWGMNRRVHESTFSQENYAPVATFLQDDRPPVVIYRRVDIPGPPPNPALDALCRPEK